MTQETDELPGGIVRPDRPRACELCDADCIGCGAADAPRNTQAGIQIVGEYQAMRGRAGTAQRFRRIGVVCRFSTAIHVGASIQQLLDSRAA